MQPPGPARARWPCASRPHARWAARAPAALYRTEGAPPPRVQPPALAQNAAFRALEPQLAPATRMALARAASPAEWNTFLLSSPEFMYA
ncbi:hypothetical protein QE399_002635 [Paracidovorax wautersii]|uniref:Uncharacterized protein n=1 Tax=Paracidovorax wautersii TaxID=1177982 RepID=A0ABU1ICI1_9BURK|nr:hypothetical protein [Paracidovorax wautersii]